MQKLLREYLDEVSKRQKKNRRAGMAVALLVVLVVVAIAGILGQYGVAMTGKARCGLEEHQHTEKCYEQVLTCGLEEGEEHTHTDDCYTQELVCGKEEHVHADICYVDPDADVEEQAVWDSQYAEAEWQGAWGADLAAAASKQVGYKESVDNYDVAENGSHKGYTRYGQFAGDVYCDWDAAFVNFCIHYAGLEESGFFPNETDTAKWQEAFGQIREENAAYLTAPEGYIPAAGDIVFFQRENEETSVQMGIVSSVNEENGTITVIEGNCGNEVKENEYNLSEDNRISSYIKVTEMENAYKQVEAEPEAPAEETQVIEPETQAEETAETEAPAATEPAEITRYDYKSDDVNVLVTLTNPEDLPDNAELVVTPVTLNKKAEGNIEEILNGSDDVKDIFAYDIKFVVDGKEVQPGSTVKVQVSLPQIEAGQGATVFHVTDDNEVKNVGGDVDEEGNVVFETPHFSTYVIVQSGNQPVNVTIKHYDDTSENGNKEIYSADEFSLPEGSSVSNYAKPTNWEIEKVVVTPDGESSETYSSEEQYSRITVSKNTAIEVYYTPNKIVSDGSVTFYDYALKVQDATDETKYYSINDLVENKENPLVVGDYDDIVVYAFPNIDDEFRKAILTKQNVWTGHWQSGQDTSHNPYNLGDPSDRKAVVKGLVTGLDDNGNVQFNNVSEPGLFTNADYTVPGTNDKYLRKVYKNYKLSFEQSGDSYTLQSVKDGSGNNVYKKGEDSSRPGKALGFFPLDNVTSDDSFWSSSWTDTWGQNAYHNFYFGMRYDIEFTIGDYLGPLTYSFTGDDDLWVILDGKKVVVDLGGIHDAASGEANLWNELNLVPGKLTSGQKEEKHTLTVLYVERGGNESNCNMEFTIPNANISTVIDEPDEPDEPVPGTDEDVTDAEVNKTAKVVNENNRIFQIDLTANSISTKTTEGSSKPIDVVLVLDVSGSMNFQDVGTPLTWDQIQTQTDKSYYFRTSNNNTYTLQYQDGKWKYNSKDITTRSGNDYENFKYYDTTTTKSRLEVLKEAAKSFVETLAKESPGSKVAIVTFASDNASSQIIGLTEVTHSEVLNDKINGLVADGGTYPSGGIEKAFNLLKDSSNEKHMIVLGDGACGNKESEPPDSKEVEKAVVNANEAKQGDVQIHAIRFVTDTAAYLDRIISDGEQVYTAADANSLINNFNLIIEASTKNVPITGATVRDTIDPRFVVTDENGTPLKNGEEVNGGKLLVDDNGHQYIEWTDQTINHEELGNGWSKTIYIKAKDDFIGGNAIPTNGSATLTYEGGKKTFPKPSVNVKLLSLVLTDQEETVYKGDTIQSSGFASKLAKTLKVEEIVDEEGSNEKATTTVGIVPETFPELTDEQKANLNKGESITIGGDEEGYKYTYPGTSDPVGYFTYTYEIVENEDGTAKGNVNNHEAENEGDSVEEYSLSVEFHPYSEKQRLTDEIKIIKPAEKGGTETISNLKAEATYVVNVIAGKIVITKMLDQSAIDYVNAQEFTFKVTGENDFEKEVTITIPAGGSQGTYNSSDLEGLVRGSYRVSEESSTGFEIKDDPEIESSTNCYYESDLQNDTVTFTMGNNTKNKDVIGAKDYQKGIFGKVVFTNEKVYSTWAIKKVSASESESPLALAGAEFSLTDANKNTYKGTSDSNGIVTWETWENGEDGEDGKYVAVAQLPKGTYTLTETKSPTGYSVNTDAWTLEVVKNGALKSIKKGDSNIKKQLDTIDGKVIACFYFEDEALYELPSTGGSGIYWYIFGGILLMSAGSLILYKNKMRGGAGRIG